MAAIRLPRSSRARLFRTSAAAAVLPLLLAGCGALSEADDSAAGDAGSGGNGEIVAAFYPLQYVAQRVAGDAFEVTNLTGAGNEPHDLELTIRETAQISDAALVIYQRSFQPAVDTAVDNNASGPVLDSTDAVDLLPASGDHDGDDHDEHGDEDGDGDGDGDDHADEHGHEDEDDHAEEDGDDHAEEHDEHGDEDADGDDHDHGDHDPHFWLDPLRMADLADAVAVELAGISPDQAEDFSGNAASLRADLEALDQEYVEGLAGCEQDTVVVSHDAFGYLDKYGLEFEPIAGLSPGAEPTPADLQRLQRVIRDEGVTTVFAERLVNPKLAQSLADDLGIDTAVLDPIEGLSDETAEEDYLSLMRSNLAALTEANSC